MSQDFTLPPTGFGPGSQPTGPDGLELDYMPLPNEMRTFEPRIVEVADAEAVAPALRLLRRVARACEKAAAGAPVAAFDLSGLDARNRALVDDTLGEGEVAWKIDGDRPLRAQESVFAGVWAVRGDGPDRIEVGPAPEAALSRPFAATEPALGVDAPRGRGVVNGPAILVELVEKSAGFGPDAAHHVVNLSLLPHTPEDLDYLAAGVGVGAATALSRGYGDCRVEATGLAGLWRVRFFNSMGALILDTFELCAMPEAALAAAEDFQDSAGRLDEVLEAIR